MHIGFLTPEYAFPNKQTGGLGTYVKKTALELYKRGNKVSIFVESDKNKKSNDHGVTVYEVKCPPLYYELNSHSLVKQLIRVGFIMYSSFKIRRKVLEINNSEPIDILQSSNYLAPGYFLKKNNRIPLVCRVSSYAPLYHAAFGIPRSLGDYLIDYLELRQVTDSSASFSPSQFMVDVYNRNESYELDFIPTPIDLDKTINSNNALIRSITANLPSKKYLLYFGSLSRIKGVDLMAKVINTIGPKNPSLGYVFIGKDYGLPNGQSISKFIIDNCEKYKNRILFFEHQSHKNLYPIIKNSFAVVAPSRVDNYPNTCLEAQFLGIPVVGTDNSSIEELIIDGKTGFIAKNSSPMSIASKIEKLLQMDKKATLEMKKNISKNVSKILSEDRIGKLISYYEEVSKKESNSKTKSNLH